MVLHGGNIAEMVTGEGKTLVATLPAYLNALAGKGVHVVTVNDYLARRDMEWMGPLYIGLGLTVGASKPAWTRPSGRSRTPATSPTARTTSSASTTSATTCGRPPAATTAIPSTMQQCPGPAALRDHRRGRQHPDRRGPHAADHLRPGRTTTSRKYAEADQIARQLKKDVHFEVKEKEHTVPPDRRGRPRGRAAGRRRELLHGRQHGMAAPDRQLAQGPPPLQARRELRRAWTARSSSSTSSPAA